jgi:hypothetical protein
MGLLLDRKFEAAMSFIIPEFFDLFPQEQMVAYMEKTFNDPEVEFRLEPPVISSIGNKIEVDDRFYAKLEYANTMHMRIVGDAEETREDKVERSDLMKGMYEEMYGKGNVEYDKATDFYSIYIEKDVISILDKGMSDWKFLVIEENLKPLLEQMLPKEALELVAKDN